MKNKFVQKKKPVGVAAACMSNPFDILSEELEGMIEIQSEILNTKLKKKAAEVTVYPTLTNTR